ncbi:MAG: preprotein translocase subunit YajC, partial [Rhodoluna sp.]|nr:preprotein translocase subunit YajC [Rhodoluna sp.]
NVRPEMNSDLFLVIALGFVIFMMFMNSRKRKKAQAEMQAGIKVGAYVLLHSGILGTIASQDEKNLVIETTPGTKLTVLKGAVRSVEEAPKKAAAKTAAAKPATATKTAAKPAAKKPVAKKPAAKPAE